MSLSYGDEREYLSGQTSHINKAFKKEEGVMKIEKNLSVCSAGICEYGVVIYYVHFRRGHCRIFYLGRRVILRLLLFP